MREHINGHGRKNNDCYLSVTKRIIENISFRLFLAATKTGKERKMLWNEYVNMKNLEV